MSPLVWVILLVIVIPMVGLLAWVIVSASIIRIRPGRLGLLLERGRPTDTVLTPGPHFVFTLRRRTVEEYPAVEMAYRCRGTGRCYGERAREGRSGLRLTLGDRTVASVPYTVRFRLRTDQLRLVHERFGAAGIFGIVRDESSRAVTAAMGDPAVTVEDLFGPAREKCQETLAAAVRERLRTRRHRRHGVRARRRGPRADRRGDPSHRTGSTRARSGAGRGGHPAGVRPQRRRPAGACPSRRRGVALSGDRSAARPRTAPGGVAGRRARSRLRTARHDRHIPRSATDEPATMTESVPIADRILEILAVLLLGITTVGTAWCGYQASQWSEAQRRPGPRCGQPARGRGPALRRRHAAGQLRQHDGGPVRPGESRRQREPLAVLSGDSGATRLPPRSAAVGGRGPTGQGAGRPGRRQGLPGS